MAVNKPEVIHGYGDDGECPRCGSTDQAISKQYEDSDTGDTYQDTYCEDCGAVLETNKVEDKDE